MHKRNFFIGESSRSHVTYRRPSLGGLQLISWCYFCLLFLAQNCL